MRVHQARQERVRGPVDRLASRKTRCGFGLRQALAEQVMSPGQQAAIAGGLAHFTGLPFVKIDGDAAIVISYLQILVPQTQGDPVEVPNHGESKGFRVHRMAANKLELLRTPEGWKFKRRSIRLLDGSEPARAILREALRA